MKPAAFALVAALQIVAAAHAQDVVSVRSARAVELRGNREAMAEIEVRVKPGFHVQANPVRDPSLIPIVLTVQPAGGIVVGTPVYPRAKRFRLEGAEDELVVLDGRFAIRVPLRASAEAAAGKMILSGKLRYQACDHEHCLFPRTLSIDIPVRVRGGSRGRVSAP